MIILLWIDLTLKLRNTTNYGYVESNIVKDVHVGFLALEIFNHIVLGYHEYANVEANWIFISFMIFFYY